MTENYVPGNVVNGRILTIDGRWVPTNEAIADPTTLPAAATHRNTYALAGGITGIVAASLTPLFFGCRGWCRSSLRSPSPWPPRD